MVFVLVVERNINLSFGLTVLDVGADLFISLISRQICVDLISVSLLHLVSHLLFLQGEDLPFGFLLAKTKFLSVSFG